MTTPNRRTGAFEETRFLLPLVLADDLTEGLVVIDRESRIQYANPAMTRIFAYGRDELEGQPLTLLMPEEYRDRHRKGFERYLATGRRSIPWSDVEFPGLHRDGHRIDLRISFTEFSRGGRRLFAGTIRNVTAAKDPREEQRILARSYRALFERNVAAVFRTAPDGRILAANGALARMAGYEDPEELRGKDVTDFYAEGEDREQLLRDLREHREVHNRELRLLRADGTVQWSLVNAVWIDDPADGEPEVLVGTVVDISDRRRLEDELQLSAERYRRLFEQELVGVYRSRPGPEGEILECNRAFAEMFGYDRPEELIGAPGLRFYGEGEAERRDATIERLRETGTLVQYEHRLHRRGGSPIWVLAHARLIEEPSGRELIEGLMFDITERVRTRRDLERSRDRLEHILDSLSEGITILDAEGRVGYANEAARRILGLTESELEGRPYDSPEWRITDLDGEPVEPEELPAARALRTGESVWGEAMVVDRPDDEPVILSVNAAPYSREDDRVVEAIISFRDITERTRAQRGLEESERRFRQMAENIEEVFWLRDPRNEEMLYVSPAFEKIWGRPVEAVYADPMTWIEAIHPGDRYRVVRTVLEEEDAGFELEYRVQRPDGGMRWIRDRAFPVTDGSGAVHRVAGVARDVTERKRVEKQLQHRALHDPLTDLPNRALFWDRLEHGLARIRRRDEMIAVLFMDLDGFKRINDEHGHGAGDEALRQVARRLRSVVREADTVARLGGDEFGVLMEDLDDEGDAEIAARRLIDRFESPVSVAGEDALIRVSCGIALAGGDAGEGDVTADELVHRADRAMYVAKKAPGSATSRYAPEIAGERTGRLRREIELQRALERGEVRPHYQPLVDLEDGRIVGAEALARWIHPERGLISPGEFIPLAEETGLIVELGRQVAHSACIQLSGWEKAGLLPPDFRLHLNLSARELERPDLVEILDGLFREVGFDPERVAFEVTETAAVESAGVLEKIRALGCPVAVDDFGTRYATLEQVTTLELDSLKLDRLFVGRIGESSRHEAVLEASLTLAEALGLCPVAEGVETEAQRRWLLEHGCRFAQGFLFAPAVPGEQLADWLRSGKRLPV